MSGQTGKQAGADTGASGAGNGAEAVSAQVRLGAHTELFFPGD